MSDTQGPKAPTSIATPKFKRGFKGFLTDTGREMKKVSWPTKKESTRLTVVVLSLVICLAVLLSVMNIAADTAVTIITKGKV
jgi:preprotein translocase subunit SecE